LRDTKHLRTVNGELMLEQKDELSDIIVGLEQRISVYETKLKDLKKKRERLSDEVATVEKYLELTKTLYRVEADKVKLANLSSHIITGDKGSSPVSVDNVADQSRELLLGRSKYAGMSMPDATYVILREAGRPMHAKELYKQLIEGGLQIRGKTPVTSIATSLKRDSRFRKVAPNTFSGIDQTEQPLTRVV